MLAEYIKERIDSGEYSPGSAISTERQYAKEFGLTQSKTHRELKTLVADGYLVSKRGSGYKVARREIKRASWRVAFLAPLSDMFSGLGEEGTTFLMKAQAENIKLDLFSHEMENSSSHIEEIIEKIISERECGAVVINPATEHADYKKTVLMAHKKRFPVIWRDFNPTPFFLQGVGPNHFEIGALAARILSSKGYRKTLFLGHSRIVGNLTFEAFSLLADTLGLAYERLDYKPDNFFDILSRRLKNIDFDSVFACTSYLSNLAYSCIMNAGIEMPKTLGFLATRRTVFNGGYPVRKVDSLVVDNQLYADKLISMLKDTLKYPVPREAHVVTMLPEYISGTTLKETNKRIKK